MIHANGGKCAKRGTERLKDDLDISGGRGGEREPVTRGNKVGNKRGCVEWTGRKQKET